MGHSAHFGRSAEHLARPWWMSKCASSIHLLRGNSFIKSSSILSGRSSFEKSSRRDSRCTCVSTTMPSALPKATPSTTFAVVRATPGSFNNSSMAAGTFPPYSSAMIRLAALMLFALFRKKPLEWIIASSSAVPALANCSAVRYFLKRAGVMRFTILSVLCAERMVATRSWSGFSWSSAHFASGYAICSRSKICSARRYLVFLAAGLGGAVLLAGFLGAGFAAAAFLIAIGGGVLRFFGSPGFFGFLGFLGFIGFIGFGLRLFTRVVGNVPAGSFKLEA